MTGNGEGALYVTVRHGAPFKSGRACAAIPLSRNDPRGRGATPSESALPPVDLPPVGPSPPKIDQVSRSSLVILLHVVPYRSCIALYSCIAV